MSVNLHLLPSPIGQTLFEANRIEETLKSLDGISRWQEDRHSDDPSVPLFDFWYTNRGDTFEIDVDRKMRAITLYGTSDTALALALQIQRAYGDEIFLVEGDNIAGAIPLSELSTVKELDERLRNSGTSETS